MDRAQHWENVYQTKNSTEVSWYEPDPKQSLDLILQVAGESRGCVLDVGGGQSFLVDRLLDAGFANVAVLDISQTALEATKVRLRAPEVAVQTPAPSFVNASGSSVIPRTLTALALGAINRKVTVLSALTSGERTGGGPNCAKATFPTVSNRSTESPIARAPIRICFAKITYPASLSFIGIVPLYVNFDLVDKSLLTLP